MFDSSNIRQFYNCYYMLRVDVNKNNYKSTKRL